MDTLTDDEKNQVLEKNAIIKLGMVARIMKCIELASAKAAYGPSDMTLVGGVYDALLKGLNEAFEEEIKKKATPPPEEPATDGTEVPATDGTDGTEVPATEGTNGTEVPVIAVPGDRSIAGLDN